MLFLFIIGAKRQRGKSRKTMCSWILYSTFYIATFMYFVTSPGAVINNFLSFIFHQHVHSYLFCWQLTNSLVTILILCNHLFSPHHFRGTEILEQRILNFSFLFFFWVLPMLYFSNCFKIMLCNSTCKKWDLSMVHLPFKISQNSHIFIKFILSKKSIINHFN